METEKSTKQSMWSQWSSPPNLVTLARIVLVVVFLGLYIGGGAWGARNIGMRWGAAIVFIIAASTDKIDGWMARKYNQVTELGKLLDPITGLYVVREIGITIMRFFVIDHGGKVIAASQAGKYKTFTLCLGLGLLLIPVWSFTHAVSQPAWLTVYFIVAYALIYFSLILCLYSGYEYLRGVFAKPAVTRK